MLRECRLKKYLTKTCLWFAFIIRVGKSKNTKPSQFSFPENFLSAYEEQHNCITLSLYLQRISAAKTNFAMWIF